MPLQQLQIFTTFELQRIFFALIQNNNINQKSWKLIINLYEMDTGNYLKPLSYCMNEWVNQHNWVFISTNSKNAIFLELWIENTVDDGYDDDDDDELSGFVGPGHLACCLKRFFGSYNFYHWWYSLSRQSHTYIH